MRRRMACGICGSVVLVPTAVSAQAQGVHNPGRTQGLVAPVSTGVQDLVTIAGPGTSVSAKITKEK